MCAVRLNTPSQQTKIDTGEIPHAWVTNIEQMTLTDSARKMHETLRRYNHATIEANKRHQIMDELQLPITLLLEKLENGYLGSIKHARTPEVQNSGKLIRQLLSEACCAHNIIINELTEKDNSATEQEVLSRNIYYALCYQARYLMEHFLTYQPISGDIWGEIKLLFRYARQRKLESIEILDKQDIPQTITAAFTTALLFASINPFRLQQQEIVLSYQIIAQ